MRPLKDKYSRRQISRSRHGGPSTTESDVYEFRIAVRELNRALWEVRGAIFIIWVASIIAVVILAGKGLV